MDKNMKVKTTTDVTAAVPGADEESAAQSAPKPDWQAPVITRIDIKRTMYIKGSGIDLGVHSDGTGAGK